MESGGVPSAYLAKARESLVGAESEHVSQRYNNCANRCYYACYQAAVAALTEAGIHPREPHGRWSHSAAQAQFAGELVRRRKRYGSNLADVLSRLFNLRSTADYSTANVAEIQSARALRSSRSLIDAIQARVGGST
jgi:uncharacterized protein (UPF0332 family)